MIDPSVYTQTMEKGNKDKLAHQLMKGGAVLSDEQILNLVEINPIAINSPDGVISYGLTSYGYDMRIARKFKIFTNLFSAVVDPKKFDPTCFIDFEGDECIVPPNSFALGVSVEEFQIPRSILAICVGKSTYARCGVVVNVTPLEPEWKGKVTIEISNTTPNPAKIYSNEGIAQVIFLKSSSPCVISYADKKGRYQDQKDLTLPFVNSTDPQARRVMTFGKEEHAKEIEGYEDQDRKGTEAGAADTQVRAEARQEALHQGSAARRTNNPLQRALTQGWADIKRSAMVPESHQG